MKNILHIAIIAIAAVALLGAVGCSDTEVYPDSPQSTIAVSGEGKIYAVPDLATLNLGVEARADTVEEARNLAGEAMEKVMQSLKDNGIAENDFQTSRFSIYPVTKWDRDTEEEIPSGFRVTNMLTVKTRELEKIGTIIDDAATAGGDLIQIQNIAFSIEEPTPYRDEAREAAISAARAKAEQLANLAGVDLGSVVSISESNGYYPVYMANETLASAQMDIGGSSAISPGEQAITVSVQISYAID